MAEQPQRHWQLVSERADFKQSGTLAIPDDCWAELPNVTLVMIETREHELADLAVRDCIRRATFGEVLIFTDRPGAFDRAYAESRDQALRFVKVEDWPDKLGWSRWTWQEMVRHVRTSHMLCIQWDSWIVDPRCWRNEWLRYDYIGAPWWYTNDGMNVGNGGFSLRSTKLMRYLRKHRMDYPCTTALDDDLLCRKYRIRLQDAGFEWAREDEALEFAFECVRPDPKQHHFGFHGCFNFHLVLDHAQLIERARMMAASRYITSNGYMWNNFLQANPGIEEELKDAERKGNDGVADPAAGSAVEKDLHVSREAQAEPDGADGPALCDAADCGEPGPAAAAE